MKFVLRDLRVGMKFHGIVEEILSGNEVLMNFQGDLVRATNESSRTLAVGETIQVVVRTVSPLGFQLLFNENPHAFRSRRLEILG